MKDDIRVIMLTCRADQGGGPEHVYQLSKGLDPKLCYIACPLSDVPYADRYAELLGQDHVFNLPHRKFSIGELFKLRKTILDNRIDVIHSHGKGAGLYSRFLGVLCNKPVVHTFHGFHVKEYGSLVKKLYSVYEYLSMVFSKFIIFVSNSEKAEVVEAIPFFSKRKSCVIYNGVESSGAVSQSVDDFKYDLVVVSRFDIQKNSAELIGALELLKKRGLDVRVCILGDGEAKNKLQQKSIDLGLNNVTFMGNVSSPREYYRQSKIFVNTSLWEGLPLAPIEAMSEGVPCVLSNVVGNIEVVNNVDDGFLYESGNIEELADLLVKLLDDEPLRQRTGQNALSKAKNIFSVEKMVAKTKELYQKSLV